jgi:hypothetical protein
MATFFSIREYEDKATALETTLRTETSLRQLDVRSFTVIPGSPFAYWAPASLILLFRSMTPVHSHGREVVSTNPLNADFRFIRLWFEIGKPSSEQAWVPWVRIPLILISHSGRSRSPIPVILIMLFTMPEEGTADSVTWRWTATTDG